jgi:hypothetical protein
LWSGNSPTEFVDDDGNAQQKSFGEINNLSGIYPDQLPTRLFINKFLSVTVAFTSSNVDVSVLLLGYPALYRFHRRMVEALA